MTIECSGCGRDIGNGGVDQAVTIVTLTDDNEPLTLRLCRTNPGDGTTPCSADLLTPDLFAHFVRRGGVLPGLGGDED